MVTVAYVNVMYGLKTKRRLPKMSYYKYVYSPIGENKYKRYNKEDWIKLALKDKKRGIFSTVKDLGEIFTVKETN